MKISEVPRGQQPPDDEELAVQWLVLRHAVDAERERPTVADLAAEIGDRDHTSRAIRELVGIGLIRLEADFVSPTRAASRYAEMLTRVGDR